MIEKMNLHYSFTNPASIHDEEALTALELAGRQGAKINEIVTDQNNLRTETENHISEQTRILSEGMNNLTQTAANIQNTIVPEAVSREFAKQVDNGSFAAEIQAAIGDTERRLNLLEGSLQQGSTTSDAELIDMRVGSDGLTYTAAGEAVRSQLRRITDSLNKRLLVNRNLRVYVAETNSVSEVTVIDDYTFTWTFETVAISGSLALCGFLIGTQAKLEGHTLRINIHNPDGIDHPMQIGVAKSLTVSPDYGYDQLWAGNIKPGENEIITTIGSNSIRDNVYLVFYKGKSLPSSGSMTITASDITEPSDPGYFLITTEHAKKATFADESAMSSNAGYKAGKTEFTILNNIGSGEYEITSQNGVSHVVFPEFNNTSGLWRYFGFGCKLGSMEEIKGKTFDIIFRRNDSARLMGVYLGSRGRAFNSPNEPYIVDITDEYRNPLNIYERMKSEYPDIPDNTPVVVYIMYNMSVSLSVHPEVNFDFGVMEILNGNVLASELSSSCWDKVGAFIDTKTQPYRYITAWGDSLTHQGGWTSILQQKSGMNLYNAGTGGEPVSTIMARQGADIMMINNITIPAEVEPVQISDYSTGFKTALGKTVLPLLQGDMCVNPVSIGGVMGTLKFTGSAYNDATGTYTFTRSKPGEAITINRPTAIRTFGDRECNAPHLLIIYMGTNGGFNSPEDAVRLHRMMIEHANPVHVLILGMSKGTENSQRDYETAMRASFGRHFVSLREYLSSYGLADAGLTATEGDTAAMSEGRVPPQLLTDEVHYTSTTKTVIGNMLFRYCQELNIF